MVVGTFSRFHLGRRNVDLRPRCHFASVMTVDPQSSSQGSAQSYSTRSDSWQPTLSSDGTTCDDLSSWMPEAVHPVDSASDASLETLASSICRSQSARLNGSIEVEHASPIPPNLEPNTEEVSDWRTLGASELVVAALNSDLEMNMLRNYQRECAPRFDAHNGKRHYSRQDVPRMVRCPSWRAARHLGWSSLLKREYTLARPEATQRSLHSRL